MNFIGSSAYRLRRTGREKRSDSAIYAQAEEDDIYRGANPSKKPGRILRNDAEPGSVEEEEGDCMTEEEWRLPKGCNEAQREVFPAVSDSAAHGRPSGRTPRPCPGCDRLARQLHHDPADLGEGEAAEYEVGQDPAHHHVTGTDTHPERSSQGTKSNCIVHRQEHEAVGIPA